MPADDDPSQRIDDVDDAILRLLDERARLAKEAAERRRDAGETAYDPEAERRALDRLAARGSALPEESLRAVYREVMRACAARGAPLRVAYLGPEGTFTHAAAREMFGLGARYAEQVTIEGVFDAVARRDAEYGVAPIENSSEGSVNHAVDALIEGALFIRGEIELPIAHCLLTQAPGFASIERVYSHPQALGQCRVWLAKHLGGAQIVHATSTAAAVREARADERGAAIASRLAAEIHGVPIARERIQDHAENVTRFVVLSTDEAPRTGSDKTTLAFSIRDERGALLRVLEIFDGEGINLTRVESRPSRQKAWEYVFLTDFEGHKEDPSIVRAMNRLRTKCLMVKHLGSYPRAPRRA